MKTRQTRLAPAAEREESASSISLRPLWRGGFDTHRGTLDRRRAYDYAATSTVRFLRRHESTPDCSTGPDNRDPTTKFALKYPQPRAPKGAGGGTPPRPRAGGTPDRSRPPPPTATGASEASEARGVTGAGGARERCRASARAPQGRPPQAGGARREPAPTEDARHRTHPTADDHATAAHPAPAEGRGGAKRGAEGRGARGGAGAAGGGGGRNACAATNPPRARGRGEGGGKQRGRGEGRAVTRRV